MIYVERDLDVKATDETDDDANCGTALGDRSAARTGCPRPAGAATCPRPTGGASWPSSAAACPRTSGTTPSARPARRSRALPRYRGEATLLTYLCAIANHVVMRTLTRRTRRRVRLTLSLDGDVAGVAALADDSPSALDALITYEQGVAFERVDANALSPPLRAALALSLEGVPYAGIARRLGIPRATVRTRLFHARRCLRLALAA